MVSYPEVRIPSEFEGMLAISLPMREVFQRIMEAASTEVPVLITGETGTGKDLVAAAIHKRSKRKDEPYIPVNTGAIAPELIASELFGHEKGAYTGASETRQGLFERADYGTIFLDEISTMSEKAQVSLLRVLETKTLCRVGGTKDIAVDARVITATNENIEEAVKEKHFREDLYYRLDVFRIHLPPLRDRPGAVTFFTDHYVSLFNAAYNKRVRVVSRETYRCLRRYPWPGNVRELRNVIQRAVLMAVGEELTPDLIPERIREAAKLDAGQGNFPIRLGMTLEAAEKELIKMTLASTGGNKKTAASILGISRRAIYNKLNRFGLL
jgi:DNA-binding NtrC family response regulator